MKNFLRFVSFLCFLSVLTLFGYIIHSVFFSNNVHAVIPGKIYRSAKLSQKNLVFYTKKFDLKSMLNFCGAHPNQHWWVLEDAFAKTHLQRYVSIKFEPTELPSKDQLKALVLLLETMPKPLIFHCTQGADRTGMAAAISVILFNDHPIEKEVKKEVSWYYGALSPHSVGYQLMQNYFDWLSVNKLLLSRESFMKFLNDPAPMTKKFGWFIAVT